MTLSEALKSHFIEKMHLLQGAWHRTTKSRDYLIWILCGHLRPPPQRPGVISFGPYRWPPSAPTKAGVLSFTPYVAILGPDGPPSGHSYRSDCRNVGADPPKSGYTIITPLGRQVRFFRKQLARLQNSGSSRSAASAPLLLRGRVGK